MANKDYLDLVNSIRDRLAEIGINADDLGTKTLRNCKKMLEVIDDILEKRKMVEKLHINRMSISNLSGMDRGTLRENPVYDQIISFYHDESPDGYKQKEKREQELKLEKYKKEVADYNKKFEAQLELNVECATLRQLLEDERRKHKLSSEALSEANKKIVDLQKQLSESQALVRAIQGRTRS